MDTEQTVDHSVPRVSDLKVDAAWSWVAFANASGGQWEKFTAGGKTDVIDKATFTPSKFQDVSIFDTSEHRAIFDRTVQGDAYVKALTERSDARGTALQDMMRAKKQSDMLSSMLQGFGMRYASRLRHTAAVLSRRSAITSVDADNMIILELNK